MLDWLMIESCRKGAIQREACQVLETSCNADTNHKWTSLALQFKQIHRSPSMSKTCRPSVGIPPKLG